MIAIIFVAKYIVIMFILYFMYYDSIMKIINVFYKYHACMNA